jgi:hypothetical protein
LTFSPFREKLVLEEEGTTSSYYEARRRRGSVKRVALQVGCYGRYEDRKVELQAVLEASTLGFDKVLENYTTDETVWLVEKELLEVGTKVDHTDENSVRKSLEYAGYEVVDLLEYLETRKR